MKIHLAHLVILFGKEKMMLMQTPSDRKFGIFFSVIFIFLAVYFWQKSTFYLAFFFSFLSALFLLMSKFSPSYLSHLNRAWFSVGVLLGQIVNPIVLGMIFFLFISPIAIMIRICGRDVLLMKKRNVKSYWLNRNPSGPHAESFRNQF